MVVFPFVGPIEGVRESSSRIFGAIDSAGHGGEPSKEFPTTVKLTLEKVNCCPLSVTKIRTHGELSTGGIMHDKKLPMAS